MAVADSWKQLIEMGYGSGGKTQRYIYNLDGIDDYIALDSPSILVANDTVALKFTAPTMPNASGRFLLEDAQGSNTTSVYVNTSSNFVLKNCTGTLDGTPMSATEPMPTDGKEHEMVITIGSSGNIGAIGGRIGGGFNWNAPIYDVDIQAASGNRFYAIDDGWSVNPVVADSIGGNNATANNFEESNWVLKDV